MVAAKNVLLAGVKQLTLIDGGVVGPSDLSAQVRKMAEDENTWFGCFLADSG